MDASIKCRLPAACIIREEGQVPGSEKEKEGAWATSKERDLSIASTPFMGTLLVPSPILGFRSSLRSTGLVDLLGLGIHR